MDRGDKIAAIIIVILSIISAITIVVTLNNLVEDSSEKEIVCSYVPLEEGFYKVQVYTNGTCVFANELGGEQK